MTNPQDLLQLLREMEWVGTCGMDDSPVCPICGAYERSGKHHSDCRLDRTITMLEDDNHAGN